MKRIFVSSTFIDLTTHRKSVQDAIRQLGAVDVSMEHFGARDDRPKDECERIIRKESDLFVGIYAHRYGHVPEGLAVSICESEYETATAVGLPRFIYLVDEATPWVPAHIDQGERATKLQALKERLRKELVCDSFRSEHDLAAKVAADLGRHLSEVRAGSARGHAGMLHHPGPAWTSPTTRNRWRHKVVAFDFDGTLLRGDSFQFSWEAVWNALGFAHSVQSELKRTYRSKALSADRAVRTQAYREWCDQTCAAFRTRKLSKGMLAGLVDSLAVTKNFESALSRLRAEGFVLAIISGGIDFFLEVKIPDYRKWFDFVFMNELRFDADGLLEGCMATEFDFDGKADALRLVCERAGCSTKESVFVGDAFNDEAIMLAADRAIAYPPKDDVVKGISQYAVPEDDLERILPHVMIG